MICVCIWRWLSLVFQFCHHIHWIFFCITLYSLYKRLVFECCILYNLYNCLKFICLFLYQFVTSSLSYLYNSRLCNSIIQKKTNYTNEFKLYELLSSLARLSRLFPPSRTCLLPLQSRSHLSCLSQSRSQDVQIHMYISYIRKII